MTSRRRRFLLFHVSMCIGMQTRPDRSYVRITLVEICLHLRLRLRFLINQKEAADQQVLSDWLKDANANADTIKSHRS